MQSLPTRATQQFTASAELSDGSTSATGFEWSAVGGGAISVSGVFTAPSAPQTSDITVMASKGGKTGYSTVLEIYDIASITTRGPISGKIGGSTTAFTTMFTAVDSSASDYDFVVSPSTAGSVNSSTGLFTMVDDVTGLVSVTATHKKQEGVSAETIFTNTSPKATIVGHTVTGKMGGDKVFFTEMFTSNTASSNFSYEVTPSTDVSINTTTGVLTLGDEAVGTYTIKATHRTQNGVYATATVLDVAPKVSLSAMTFIGKFGGDKVFFGNTFNNYVNSVAADYIYSVSPESAITQLTETSFVLADDTEGLVTITATHKTLPEVTATSKFVDVAYKSVITAKDASATTNDATVPFSDMFTSNYESSHYNYVVSPTEAGTASSSGDFTPSTTFSGVVTIKATHKSQRLSTATHTVVVSDPKTKSVVSVDIQPKEVSTLSYGETVQFTGVVTYDDGSTSTDVLFVRPIGFGEIHGKNGLYTAPSRTITDPIKIEVWAAEETTIRDYAYIAGVQPA